jgi:hypothetical protein
MVLPGATIELLTLCYYLLHLGLETLAEALVHIS